MTALFSLSDNPGRLMLQTEINSLDILGLRGEHSGFKSRDGGYIETLYVAVAD